MTCSRTRNEHWKGDAMSASDQQPVARSQKQKFNANRINICSPRILIRVAALLFLTIA
jgi:hypothetical protein